jgi:hypothetical protein
MWLGLSPMGFSNASVRILSVQTVPLASGS